MAPPSRLGASCSVYLRLDTAATTRAGPGGRQRSGSGIRSEHAYAAAFASIGLSVLTWATSLKVEKGQDLERADHWGIYVGEWAPTFFGLGLAHYEKNL